MEKENLLKNEKEWIPPGTPMHYFYQEDSKLLTLAYDNATVVVDCGNRKRIAQYASPDLASGCLINGEYWMGTPNGVVKKPFPMIEEIPKRKPAFY